MKEKIKEAKISILDRIIKAVSDDTKSLSADALMTMADISAYFDDQEMRKDEPKYNPDDTTDKLIKAFSTIKNEKSAEEVKKCEEI